MIESEPVDLLQAALGAVAVLVLAVLVFRTVGDRQRRERAERNEPE